MMKRPVLTLTRSKQISAICWGLLVVFGGLAQWFPVRSFPEPVRGVIVVFVVALWFVLMLVMFGCRVEKGDERSVENERRTNSTLFTLFFVAMGVMLVWMKNGQTVTLGQSDILVIFGCVCLAQDVLFLLYECFGD